MRKLNLLKSLAGFVGLLLLVTAVPVRADLMIMVRTHQGFPEAMSKLQEIIRKKGYTISRVQRVDIGLTKSGYKTDKYRVVFFGRPEEIRQLVSRHPDLAAFLPLKISIFAEGNDTILVTANPQHLKRAGGKQLHAVIRRWEKDIGEIFANMREEE